MDRVTTVDIDQEFRRTVRPDEIAPEYNLANNGRNKLEPNDLVRRLEEGMAAAWAAVTSVGALAVRYLSRRDG